jgi:hypothetical protein
MINLYGYNSANGIVKDIVIGPYLLLERLTAQ